MNVGFFLVDTGSVDYACGVECAEGLIASVRASMPKVQVVHFTDEQTPMVEGADAVRRLPMEPMAMLRSRHQSQVSGEWLFVDSDVLIQRDVRDVFAQKFDIAVTTRDWPHLKAASGFTERMPFNIGVTFSRSPEFWASVCTRVGDMSDEWQHWMGDQQAVCDLLLDKASRYRVAYLKGSRYNLPPSVDADPSSLSRRMERKASILHFKGLGRKSMMIDRLRGAACG